jgi:membrane associated rhomboid family serine protease
MNIFVSLHGGIFAILNCLWIPSPQSKRMFSEPWLSKTPTWFFLAEGVALPVPRKVILILFAIFIWGESDLRSYWNTDKFKY